MKNEKLLITIKALNQHVSSIDVKNGNFTVPHLTSCMEIMPARQTCHLLMTGQVKTKQNNPPPNKKSANMNVMSV